MQETWHPIGLLSQTPPKSAHPVILNGQMLALWRDESGQVQVWQDRCPHRGMRLSFGFVTGDRLTCLYHGWQYDRAGGCKLIPAHPDMTPPDTITVGAYPVALHRGMILTCLAAEAPPAPEASGDEWEGVRSIYVAQSAANLTARLQSGAVSLGGIPLRPGGIGFGADQVAVGVQPVDGTRSALHVAAQGLSVSERLNIARELVALRHIMELEGEPA